ncbi:hypothetical protein C7121_20055 [Paenibacillus glucanolyticus]|uniref:hypothetical protein n=2 Tax=Paenibacillus TaxID=44249 RepID=UPI0003E2AA0C|nr:hypothetical protein C7121_20055 [Paenibacillus glucanolyticus]ETT42465.1 hypothetical protein C169_04267 [Paenibacillus sp. FSL R5-808]MCA4752364.1 hypothetical protein [Mycolicibacterium fortuitum]
MSRSEAGLMPTIVMGTFDPETRWRDPNLTRLPAMPDRERESIVLCMDELLFPFCGPDDILYSRCQIDPELYEYLAGLGFSFRSRYHFDLSDEKKPLPEADVFKRCMFRLAADQTQNQITADRMLQAVGSGYPEATGLAEMISLKHAAGGLHREAVWTHTVKPLTPYAITADTEVYLQTAGPFSPLPDLETVVRVNSKIYSNRLLARIGEKCYGMEANSAAEMESAGNTLLKQGPYLLKDPFGVSGKGNLLIDGEAMQRRIAGHLDKQERSGLRSQFLLEPLLRRGTDFSSHWFIRENGEKDFISVQRMMNQQQNYGGSIKADEALIRLLEHAGYFDTMEKALGILAEDGYHGFVCFDSMILENGDVVPIVEINARMSMGLINAYLNKVWETHGHTSWLTFLSLGLPEGFAFGRLLDALRVSGLLLTVQEGYGIVPLSSNTVMVNDILTSRRITDGLQSKRGMPKGRLYVSVVGRDNEHRSELINRLRQVLADLSVKVYN